MAKDEYKNENSATTNALKKCFSTNSASRIMNGFNPDKYANDNSKHAQHAKKWGAMKPYYLEYKEKKEARLKNKSKKPETT